MLSISIAVRAGLLIVFLALLAALLWYDNVLDRPLGTDIVLVVEPGTSVSAIARDLSESQQLPVSSWVFVSYARITSDRGFLQAGAYQLQVDDSIRTLVDRMRQGETIRYLVTIPEGLTVKEWRERLASDERLREAASSENELAALLINKFGIEGQFFPDTYEFGHGDTVLDIFRRAHQRMWQVLNDEWHFNENRALASPYEALILASIIEKETGAAEDRDLIASVFTNRLNRGMKLQSDPTVIYGVPDFDGDLTRRHLRTPTPYNTYVIPGLPPGPIANPGLAAIRAALHPAVSDYLYFVARGDGRSYFSTSLEEHNQAVRQFQINNRSEDYRSAPGSP